MKLKAQAIIIPLLLALPLGGCFTQTYTHGSVITNNTLSQIEVGSSREHVELVLGSPATTSNLDGVAYYYISQKTSTTAFFGPEIIDQRVVAVYFDEKGFVRDLGNYGLQDGKVFDFLARKTRTGGADYGFLTQILRGASKPSLNL